MSSAGSAHRDLSPLIDPRSVAVVGVSRDPSKFGRVTIDNLLDSPVTRELYAVGNAELDLRGATVLSAVDQLPAVDVAIIASPAHAVVEVVDTAARQGISNFIVFASDFAEGSDSAGMRRDRELRELIDTYQLNVVGPNTLGVVSFANQFPGTFVPCRAMKEVDARIAVVSQSGGLGWILSHARHEGVGISHMIGAGNSTGLDVVDFCMGLLNDPDTDVITLAFEGLRDGGRIAALGVASLRAGKPIVAWKTARSDLGAERAMSHTGTLSGNAKLYSAAFAEAGIIEVSAFEDLLETAALAAASRGKSADTFSPVVASSSGGAVVMAADSASERGVALDPPSARAAERLASVLPGFTAPTNPLDITSFIQAEESALETIVSELTDGERWPLVFPWSTSHTPASTQRIRNLVALSDKLDLPTAVVLLSRWTTSSDRDEVWASRCSVPFGDMNRTFGALAGIGRWVRARDHLAAEQGADMERSASVSPTAHFAPLANESDIRDWWNLPRPAAVEVKSREQTAASLVEMRPPAALKFPNDVEHKWSKGGVYTDICDPESARDAFDLLLERFRAHTGETESRLVLEKQAARGPEIFLSMLRDPTFGEVLLVGPGGTAVDRNPDAIIALMGWVNPTARRERIAEVVRETVAVGAVETYRASAEAFAEQMSQCFDRFRGDPTLRMVEFNPTILSSSGQFHVVDAVVTCMGGPGVQP